MCTPLTLTMATQPLVWLAIVGIHSVASSVVHQNETRIGEHGDGTVLAASPAPSLSTALQTLRTDNDCNIYK